MSPNNIPGSGAPGGGEISSAALFALLWDTLVDLLGTAAASTILRRAALRAASRSPELALVVFSRVDMEYAYDLPTDFQDRFAGAGSAMYELVRELLPLLVEMTGQVVVRRIEQIPQIQACGILPA
jgi:hypothetical protein